VVDGRVIVQRGVPREEERVEVEIEEVKAGDRAG
jgi:hypothetical protein